MATVAVGLFGRTMMSVLPRILGKETGTKAAEFAAKHAFSMGTLASTGLTLGGGAAYKAYKQRQAQKEELLPNSPPPEPPMNPQSYSGTA